VAEKPDPAKETLKIANIEIKVDPVGNKYSERHGGQRDYFYVKNVHGLDMDWAFKTYSSWIDHESIDQTLLMCWIFWRNFHWHSFVGGEIILK
jgi:hypothetical protein